ncbi:hypothetical protein LguiA_031218 [Lonicera macranthoides]
MVGLSVILEEDQSQKGNSVGKKASQIINKVVTENDSVGYSGNQLLVPRFPVSGTRMKITQRAVYGKMEKMTKSRPVCAE